MQAIRREWKEQGGKDVTADTSILKKIFDQLESMPSVKDEKEVKRYNTRKAYGSKKKDASNTEGVKKADSYVAKVKSETDGKVFAN